MCSARHARERSPFSVEARSVPNPAVADGNHQQGIEKRFVSTCCRLFPYIRQRSLNYLQRARQLNKRREFAFQHPARLASACSTSVHRSGARCSGNARPRVIARRAVFTSSARVGSETSAIRCSIDRDASQRCTVVAPTIGPALSVDIAIAPVASVSRAGECVCTKSTRSCGSAGKGARAFTAHHARRDFQSAASARWVFGA